MKKPEPVNKHIVCSVCGLDWDAHEQHAAKTVRHSPTLEVCVELLKAELAKRPKWQPNQIYSANLGAYGTSVTQ